jgi:hypothetical protein
MQSAAVDAIAFMLLLEVIVDGFRKICGLQAVVSKHNENYYMINFATYER